MFNSFVTKNFELFVSLCCTMYVLCSAVQLCLTLCNPSDCSPPGSSVHGIFQARILEWVAISYSPGDLPDPGIETASLAFPALAGGFFITVSLGKPHLSHYCILMVLYIILDINLLLAIGIVNSSS